MTKLTKGAQVSVEFRSGGSVKGLFVAYDSLGSHEAILVKTSGVVLEDAPCFIPIDDVKSICILSAKEYRALSKIDDLHREQWWKETNTMMHEGLIQIVPPSVLPKTRGN